MVAGYAPYRPRLAHHEAQKSWISNALGHPCVGEALYIEGGDTYLVHLVAYMFMILHYLHAQRNIGICRNSSGLLDFDGAQKVAV